MFLVIVIWRSNTQIVIIIWRSNTQKHVFVKTCMGRKFLKRIAINLPPTKDSEIKVFL